MSRLQSNLIANFAGVGWNAVMQFACVPFYIKLMGIESYALIGFYLTLLSALQILDLGLSSTANREMARYSVDRGQPGSMRDFVRTLEAVYWSVGTVLGGIVVATAGILAHRWINAESLSDQQVRRCIAMMGALIVLQWPLSFYQGALMGLQRQVLLNAIKVVAATLAGVGAILLLVVTTPDVTRFFAWQILVSALQVCAAAVALWTILPSGPRARFDVGRLRAILHFGAGMSGIAVFGLILGQMDKVVLSRLLPLGSFGYYSLAATVVNGLYLFISPVFQAVYPRLSALVAQGDESRLRVVYHSATQLLAALIVPVTIVLALFPAEVVQLWTQNAQTARQVGPIVALMVGGTAINGLMHLPYALQLAYGWTRVGFVVRLGQVVLFLPVLIAVARSYGGVGAAAVWLVANIVYMAVTLPWTHGRLLKADLRRWLLRDVGLPSLAAAIVAAVARMFYSPSASPLQTLIQLGLIGFVTVAAAVCVAPALRSGIIERSMSAGTRAAR